MKRLLVALTIFVMCGNWLGARDIMWKRYFKEMPKYDSILNKYAAKYGVDRTLAEAVISWESNWSRTVVGEGNCVGLGQIKGGSKNPDKNIKCVFSMLSKYLKTFKGDTHLALAAYNMGIGKAKHRAKNHALQNTYYTRNVMKIYGRMIAYKSNPVLREEFTQKLEKPKIKTVKTIKVVKAMKIAPMKNPPQPKRLPVTVRERYVRLF